MKKKFLIAILIVLINVNLNFAQPPLECGISLNWTLLNQEERDKTVNYYKEILFKDVIYKLDATQFKDYRKDPDFLENRIAIKQNVLVLANRKLAVFNFLNKLMVAYAVKYNCDKTHIYYYNALGHLIYFDILTKPYDEFPYIAYQYDKDGNLKSIIYNISEYDQYAYKANGDFYGRWYKDKCYNKKAKLVMTRVLPE